MDSFMTEVSDCTMEVVMKNIYTSCDPENSNLVPVSKLIEFITPYMLQDLSALENLKCSLDPGNDNVCVSSEKFYEVMNEWAKKITNSSDEESDFNKTPSALEIIDEKQLPYIQSTPRASFGQKLLSCEGLLNLSNVSAYSLSTSVHTKENAGPEKTILEEEIKRMEHHLNKVSNEMAMVKLQLTAAEEQNEILQADLELCKTRLHSEQQIIEHLQNDKRYNDELREELNATKKQIKELNKKLLHYEKENHHLLNVIKETETENTKLEEKCDELSRREQEAKKEIISIKTDLDLKDQEITTILKINDELRSKLNQQRDIIDQLTNENELLEHQKNNLEKALQDKLSARRDSLLYQYKTCLSDSSDLPSLDQGSDEEHFFKMQDTDFKNVTQESLHAEISKVVQDKTSFHGNYSLLSFENNEKLMELEDNFSIRVYKDEIYQLKLKNGSIQSKLEAVNQENDKLLKQVNEMKEQMCTLQQDLSNLLTEKNDKDAIFEQIKEQKNKIESEVKELKQKILELTDQNNNLSEREKSMNSTLELKSKIMTELEQNLLELKREFASLQMENIAKEKELSAKFNFEAAYKKIQVELSIKNEEIQTLTESNEELKKLLSKLTTSNQQLELMLKQAKVELKEHENKSKDMMSLNENITLTATQVQIHLDRKNDMINELVDLNQRFESNITKLEEDLQNKIAEVTELQDNLKADMEIKNIMWRDNKELKLQLDEQVERNEELSNEIEEIGAKCEEEYRELLSNYNREVEKNCKLCDQIYTYKNDLSSATKKFNEEVEKNCKLYEQVSALKLDIDTIREDQGDCKAKINKKLADYENLINCLEKKLQEAESENAKMKSTLAVIEKRKSRISFDTDVSSSESSKNRSFEKQKLTIDRLKEKLENTEEKLKREKMKREILEQSMKDKDAIEDKYAKVLLDFEQAQCSNLLEKQTLQDTISTLSSKVKMHEDRSVELENKLKETEENLSIKLSQMEQQNQHLFTELRNNEFVIKNAFLEIETYKNLFKNADQKAQELSKSISVYLLESNNKQNEIQLLNTELQNRDVKIASLTSKLSEKDTELSGILNQLTEEKNINMTLAKENKSLQEMLSKSDDHKEKELLDIEHKLKNTQKLLQCNEVEVNLMEKRLADSKQQYEIICNEISKHENVITNGRAELSRASDLVFNKWDEILQRESVYKELVCLKGSEPSEKGGEICALDSKIKVAVLLLELLATKAPVSMDGTDYGINSLLNTKANANQYSQSDVKMIQKFTLRPSRLIINRPISPDSPSVDIIETNAEVSQGIHFKTTKDIFVNQTPDCYICEACPCQGDDSYESAHDELSFSKDVNIEFTSFQDAFPNISDTFLEKLGLFEGSPRQNLSKEETEELFATFAIQIALDSRDIKERLQKQKDRCVQQQEKFLSLVKDISNRLRDHKCIGAADPISPVFVLLEDLKFLVKDLTRSTEQFGVLMCENRMMKCWNLVTNYMALLKQDVTKMRTIEPTPENEPQIGTITSLGIKFKKRLQTLGSRDEINCSTSVTSSENAETRRNRYKCCGAVKKLVVLTCVLMFLLSALFISIHWHCRMTAHENQVCVLDDFIKKIQIGNPPY